VRGKSTDSWEVRLLRIYPGGGEQLFLKRGKFRRKGGFRGKRWAGSATGEVFSLEGKFSRSNRKTRGAY